MCAGMLCKRSGRMKMAVTIVGMLLIRNCRAGAIYLA